MDGQMKRLATSDWHEVRFVQNVAALRFAALPALSAWLFPEVSRRTGLTFWQMRLSIESNQFKHCKMLSIRCKKLGVRRLVVVGCKNFQNAIPIDRQINLP